MDSSQPNVIPSKTILWTVQDSECLYQVKGWGEPYFSVNTEGHVQVSPLGPDLMGLICLSWFRN